METIVYVDKVRRIKMINGSKIIANFVLKMLEIYILNLNFS